MISENVEYTEKDHEVFEVYSRFRLDGQSKQQALITLMQMEYTITPKIINAIKKYDKQIFWSFYS
jgi:hypothetical protein